MKTYTNKQGGKQAFIGVACHLFPAKALIIIAEILFKGSQKYGIDNWRKISVEEHLNHAMKHILEYLRKDTSENHLGNAACRLLFALDLYKKNSRGN